jgi:4-hydroxy-3-methylbut-2-en-1-yl diphosphate reductase
MVKITIVNPHGFCFGVARAIKIAQKTAKISTKPIYLLGELVHNQHVINWLETELKIKTIQNIHDVPRNSIVIIRAHGVTPEIYQQAKTMGLEIVDATCPLVMKSHLLVKKLVTEHKKIIFLASKVDHDEAVGVVGEAPNDVTAVSLSDITAFDITQPQNTVLVTQTTLSTTETKKIFDILKSKYPNITIYPHICQATTDRQSAVLNISKISDMIIIIGSKTSANSQSLYQVAVSTGVRSYIIESVVDLEPSWFDNIHRISISTGASTPENLLEEVVNKIKTYDKSSLN